MEEVNDTDIVGEFMDWFAVTHNSAKCCGFLRRLFRNSRVHLEQLSEYQFLKNASSPQG
jgi:hypothetical protein